MLDVAALMNELFKTRWRELHADGWADSDRLQYPGVYLLAYDARDLAGQKVKIDDVYYVGMSNSAGGVRARLKQFKSALERGYGHSGGNHFFITHKKRPFSKLRASKRFYFTALCLQCRSLKTSARPDDFRKMGHVACLEYYAIAHVLAKSASKKVPPLNHAAGGVLIGPAEEPQEPVILVQTRTGARQRYSREKARMR
jgi:hypothetical protein